MKTCARSTLTTASNASTPISESPSPTASKTASSPTEPPLLPTPLRPPARPADAPAASASAATGREAGCRPVATPAARFLYRDSCRWTAPRSTAWATPARRVLLGRPAQRDVMPDTGGSSKRDTMARRNATRTRARPWWKATRPAGDTIPAETNLLRSLALGPTAFGVVLGLGALGAAAGALGAPSLAARYGPGPMMLTALAITPSPRSLCSSPPRAWSGSPPSVPPCSFSWPVPGPRGRPSAPFARSSPPTACRPGCRP